MPPARSAGGRPSGEGVERRRAFSEGQRAGRLIILAEMGTPHHRARPPETANPTMLTAEEAKRHVEAAEQIRGASGLQVNYPVAAQVAVHSSMQTSPAS